MRLDFNKGGWDTYRIAYTPSSIVSQVLVRFCQITCLVWGIAMGRVVSVIIMEDLLQSDYSVQFVARAEGHLESVVCPTFCRDAP